MATLTKDDILDAIAGMTVLELSELLKDFEEKFGVTAAAPVAAFAGPMPDASLAVVADVGIRLVSDFRVDREVYENPSRLADHPELRCQRLPIGGDEVEGKSILDVIRAGELKTYTIDDMAATYERLL